MQVLEWLSISKFDEVEESCSFHIHLVCCCSPLNSYSQLEDYLWSMYAGAAQYNQPPRYPVTRICDGIDGASSGSGTLGKIAAGVFAYEGKLSCYNLEPRNETETDVGWRWQVNLLLNTSIYE